MRNLSKEGNGMENYIMLNGKRIDLTAEQIETLVGKQEKDPFERVKTGKIYYFVDYDGCVEFVDDCLASADNDRYAVGNYCTDKELMEQRALHETLNRLLWRYSMQHGGREVACIKNETTNWYISTKEGVLYTSNCYGKRGLGEVAFCDEQTVNAAIEEIVKPFMEKHPEFRW
jgi:hypothetical protein